MTAVSDQDELQPSFYAKADQMSVTEARRFAKAMARWRQARGDEQVEVKTAGQRTLFDALGIRDPFNIDFERLWAPRRTINPEWMRFPVGLDEAGQLFYMDLKEGNLFPPRGMNMHGAFIGTTGAGKTEGIVTEVASACATHSPDVLNVFFTDFKLKSAGGDLERLPHVVGAVSNLEEDKHLVGRLYETMLGELEWRANLIKDIPNCPDLTTYNALRQKDPSLPAVPVLWWICDEYQEMLNSRVWGEKFKNLFDLISRQGRSLHVKLQLVGQSIDGQRLREARKQFGYTIAGRVTSDMVSQEAIGSKIATTIPSSGAAGTVYVREGVGKPRKMRFFYAKEEVSARPETTSVKQSLQRGKFFAPRAFSASTVEDTDGQLTAADQDGEVEQLTAPVRSIWQITALEEGLARLGAKPPRPGWLPPLNAPEPVDALVARLRGKPWYEDYGNTDGLVLPVGLEDVARRKVQRVYCLDVLSQNAMVVGAPQTGATTALMTAVTGAALMYRPERVQFYCIAGSGPELAQLNALPHVISVMHLNDREGVDRLLATVEGIKNAREIQFSTQNLDIGRVRRANFEGVPGGDVVLIVDGLAAFEQEFGDNGLNRLLALMRSHAFGVRVVFSSNSYIHGLRPRMKQLASQQRLELLLAETTESMAKREEEPMRRVAEELKLDNRGPGHGLSMAGYPLLVGRPELADWKGQRVTDAEGVGQAVAEVAQVDDMGRVARLPERIDLAEVLAMMAPGTSGGAHRVPIGLSEQTMAPAFIDFDAYPHVLVTGLEKSGRTNFLRVLCRGIMDTYSTEEAVIAVIDPHRKLAGVVSDAWTARYCYKPDDIKQCIHHLGAEVDKRLPPPGTSQTDLLTKKFWTGKRMFVVIDDLHAWPPTASPLAELARFAADAGDAGIHLLVGTNIQRWQMERSGLTTLGHVANTHSPVLILDGRREHGVIAGEIKAAPQRPGKGVVVAGGKAEGVLIGWSEPPVSAIR